MAERTRRSETTGGGGNEEGKSCECVWRVNERAENEGSSSRSVAGQRDCRPAGHHALTHEIFKISDTRTARGSPRREVNQLDPLPSSSSSSWLCCSLVPFRIASITRLSKTLPCMLDACLNSRAE